MARLALLPHQFELLLDYKTKILGCTAGFGSGKTYAVARKAVDLMLRNPGCDGICTEPNYPLLTQILLPELKLALDEFGIDYDYKAAESIFYCQVYDRSDNTWKETRIIAKSMESWERLIGINAAWVIMDEFDTAKTELAYNAYTKLLGRLRAGNTRQMVIVSTPEGYKAMHQIFIEEDDEQKRLIKAKSTDNHHLPPDYIETMRNQYPPELIDAYINGEFTNLTSGTVYTMYDRTFNNTTEEDDLISDLHIGVDFNVGQMSAVVARYHDQKLYVIDELHGLHDTPALVEALEEKYIKTMAQKRRLYVYPDASGKNRSSTDASVTNHKLLRAAGFQLRVDTRNPGIMTRVNTTNTRFKNANDLRQVFINLHKCPELVKGLEQQAYDPKTKLPDKNSGIDHQLDALGYMVTYMIPLTFSRQLRKSAATEPHAN